MHQKDDGAMEKVPDADDYGTMIVDEVTFGDGPTELVKYYDKTENGIHAEFKGKKYNVDYDRSGVRDKIEKKKKKWKNDKKEGEGNRGQKGSNRDRRAGVRGYTRSASNSAGVLKSITSTDDHNVDGVNLTGGVAQGATDYGDQQTESAVQVAYLSDVETGVEIWKDVYLDDENGLIKIYGWGEYAGTAASALAGGLVEGGVLFRRNWANMYNERKYASGLSVDLGLADGWGGNSNWEAELYTDNYESGWWSIGIRLRVNAAAAGPASAIVDLASNENNNWDFDGFFDFDYINVIDA
ncbi:hypothetical protein ACFQMA_02070 [Halosimplex aquaticum]|uniref:Uncharacterized protein n=1 Tax=Halosimplex aquaticum TaxID=3026162 RepID=A0ABD5XYQ9_9EURY|nr:hypothetical protein [Halosimplex aquaticum]